MTDQTDWPLPLASPTQGGFRDDQLRSISLLLDSSVNSGKIPGAIAVVAREGKIVFVHSCGHADIAEKTPLTPNSLFRLYSQTKPLTAALTMRLQEKGIVFLDAAINDVLPEYANMQVRAPGRKATEHVRGRDDAGPPTTPALRDITVRDLLTMTSGLSPFASDIPAVYLPQMQRIWQGTGFFPGETYPDTTLLNGSYADHVIEIGKLPLATQPGQKWKYGSDYDVLTLYLERLCGKPFDELLKQELFDPLGMLDTDFYCTPDNCERLTSEHTWDEGGHLKVLAPAQSSERSCASENKVMSGNGLFGGVLSCPRDFVCFAQMMLDDGIWKEKSLLGRKTIELMTTDHIPFDEVNITKTPDYGFGFGVAIRRSLAGAHTPGSMGEFGWGGFAGTSFFVDPKEKLTGMFFTHVYGFQMSPDADLYEQFQTRVYQALK